MKNACAWLAVLLALLLPVQGVVAAAMWCPHEVAHAEPQMRDETNHSAMADDAMAGDEMMVVAATPVQHPAHGHAHAEKCGLCAACCLGAVLASPLLTAVGFGLAATEAFPTAALPSTSFLSEGLERPPRSF